MSDILIRRMEMPKNCKQCFYMASGCKANKHNNGRPQDCPLIAIPPHGRLIDADALKEFFPDKGEGSWTYNIVVSGIIRDAPTVIPAEEGELWTK